MEEQIYIAESERKSDSLSNEANVVTSLDLDPSNSASPLQLHSPTQLGDTGTSEGLGVGESQLDQGDVGKDVSPTGPLENADLKNTSLDQESNLLLENPGISQEIDLMSLETNHSGVKREGVEEDGYKDVCLGLNGNAVHTGIDGSSENGNTTDGNLPLDSDVGKGSFCEAISSGTVSDTCVPSEGNTEQKAAITSLELAAAAKEETFPGKSSNNIMTSSIALCKYRWAKVVSTDSADIGFYPSYAPTEPILLSWDAAFKAYLSPELRIECGNYHGVLKVDGNALHVEDFVVKSYTFEVDLFIKEDILESKCPSPPTVEFRASPSNTGCAAPIPTTLLSQNISSEQNASEAAKILEKVKPYLTPKDDTDLTPTRDSTVNHVDDLDRKSPLTNSGVANSLPTSILKSSSPLQFLPVRRASPIGDDKSGESVKVGSEYFDSKGSLGERTYSLGADQSFGHEKPIIARSHETVSHTKSSSATIDDIVGGAVGSRTDDDGLPVRLSASESRRSEEPGRLTNYREKERRDRISSDQILADPVTSNFSSREERLSLHSSSKDNQDQFQRPTDGVYGRPPPQPSRDRPDEDSLGYTSMSSASDKRRQEHDKRPIESSSYRERHRDIDSDDSLRNKDKLHHKHDRDDVYSHRGSRPHSVPSHNKDGRYESTDIEGRPRSRGSREGSYGGSQHSSRTNSHSSLTSEQELGQYWDSEHRSRGEVQRERWQHDDDISGRSGRLERPASVPNYGTCSETGTDKRSSTPDNRVRVPPSSWSRSDRNSLTTDRVGEGHSGRTSVASSDGRRTITPGINNRQLDTDDTADLRNTVDDLRQLVSRRDSEISSLRDELQDIKHDRSSRHRDSRSAHSSAERVQNSLEYKQLQSEKEILATEVASLREEVHRLSGRHLSGGRGGEGGGRTSAISDYSPYSPMVLQRKIADLESQIHDLQEVNETTTSSLSRTEEKVRLLQEENHDLRSRVGNNLEDSGDQHSLRVQMRTLREDIASLRERNFQLTEENMKLQEGQGSRSTSVPTGLTMQRSGSSLGLKSDDNQTSHSLAYAGTSSSVYGSRYPSGNSTVTDSNKPLLSYTSRSSREDLAPKDYRNRGSSLGRVHNPESQTSTAETSGSKYFHQRNAQHYSPRLRFSSPGSDVISHKPPNASSLTSRSASSMSMPVADRDRSRPDGEVSEHVHTDRYRPVIRSSYDSVQQDRGVSSSTKDSNNHKSASYSFSKDRSGGSSKDSYADYRREDTYLSYLSDSKLDRSSSARQPKTSSKGNALGSKDIFMNLKNKLASQWLQQENRYISGNLDFDRYQSSSGRDKVEEDGDDSDTATDILLAQDTGTSQVSFRSGKSLGSDGGLSSDEAADDIESSGHLGGTSSLRRRCRSADPATNARQSDTWRDTNTRSSRNFQPPSTSAIQRSEKNRSGSPFSSRRGTSSIGAPTGEDREDMRSVSSAGHRSVLPTPLVTQHNKHELAKSSASLLNSTLTQGLRPFAPRSPADIRIDDVVKFSRLGGMLTQGCVKYVGHLPGRSEVYLGVELDRDEGKHDGTFEEIRYFKCKPNKGVFVAFNKIVMAWAP